MAEVNPTSKPCRRCKVIKVLEEFYKAKLGKLGRSAQCKICINARNAEYRARPGYIERHTAVTMLWVSKNIERCRATARRATSKKRSTPRGLLEHRISQQIRSGAFRKRPGRKTFEMLGYSPDSLRLHIQLQFLPDMSWGNAAKWHIDHIIPISKFSLSSEDDVRKAWALTNLRPMWARDNMVKKNKIVSLF